ncbi:recombinase family protein [Photobacterium swingsii]|uniref:recombinase family protein n=1 Tax=Photobacterium swingsii TaxID=680026 RepID=UPI003D0EA337
MTTRIAYLYSRFSTLKQQHGDSQDRQQEIAQLWCDRHGVQLSTQSFSDLGVSAFKEKTKPALDDFIAAVESGRVERGSYLLIEDDDRLSRRGWKHTQDLMHRLVALGVEVVITKTGVVYNEHNINDLGQSIVLMVNADRSYKESERKSHLIRAQRTRAREQRLVVGQLPAWIKRADNALGFEFNELIDCINRLIEVRLQGKSLQAVAKVLNTEGFTTKRGSMWSKIGVESIIRNHALYGAKQYFDSDPKTGKMNQVPIDIALNIFPAVIDYSKWQDLQGKSPTGKGGRKSKLGAYSQLLKCGVCGGAMTIRTSKYKGELRSYRRCAKSIEGGCSESSQVREPEKYLDRVLRDLTYQTTSTTKRVSRVPELQEQIKTLSATQDILISAGQSTRLAALYVRLGELEDQLQEEMQLDLKQNDPVITSYAKILDIQDVDTKNMQLRKLLTSIKFYVIEKVKTASRWRVVVEQSNGLTTSFFLNQKHGFGNTEVVLISDGNAVIKCNAGHELEPWEQ